MRKPQESEEGYMSDVQQFKCPSCGGTVEFDSKSQKMKCPYCDTEFEIEQFSGSDDQDDQKKQGWKKEETEGMKVYVCESCGGEIIADEKLGASDCPFCGNKIVFKENFQGDLRPEFVIPFQLDKKDAKQAYLSHLKGKAFLPKVFREENHIDEIKGIYVPFWLYDVDVNAEASYSGQKTRSWIAGDTQYVEQSHYKVTRRGNMSFTHIPADGSKTMADELMESIEPYDFKQAVPFETAYLAGYLADRYDVGPQECEERIKERASRCTQENLRNTVKGYDSVSARNQICDFQKFEYHYALYPVWILNTTWKNKNYIFAMNGQTGKLVGDLPADFSAFWKFVGVGSVLSGIVIYALLWLFTLI